jgi:hypothetical protein
MMMSLSKLTMKTKFLLIGFILFITGFTLKAQTTIFVDASNATGVEDGTQIHPFNTIKEGINASTQGSTVMIKQGTYTPDDSWSGNDHTLLLKAGVKLHGESRDNTLISGIVVDKESSNLSISLENLRFNEFYFCRATNSGSFTEPNIIRNCSTGYIDLSFGRGIPVNDTIWGPNFGFIIENNDLGKEGNIEFKQGAGVSDLSVIGNSCGSIQLKSGAGYTYRIDGNMVQNGIWDKSGANTTTISNNTVLNGTISDKSGGNQYGLEDEIIENNTITAYENSPTFTDEEWKAAIDLSSRSATVRNNQITCYGHVSGIRSKAGAPLHILNNVIKMDEVQSQTPDPYDDAIGIFNYSGWGRVNGNKIQGGSFGYYSKAGTIEFANNEIDKAYSGFSSVGAEEVHHNTIINCKGDGMILAGLKGPVHNNTIKNNGGSGVRITRVPIDLGGGMDACPGMNTITGNGNYDLYIETSSAQNPVLYARYNIWDHTSAADILLNDIRDAADSSGLVSVDFLPFGVVGISKPLNNSSFSINPNPLNGNTTINWMLTYPGRVKINLYNSTGLQVKEIADMEMMQGENRLTFDASDLPKGVYLCRISTGTSTISRKIVKL